MTGTAAFNKTASVNNSNTRHSSDLVLTCLCRVDSIMLVEEGFQMVSVDASDKMLKYALKARWERRKEAAFDQWGRSRTQLEPEPVLLIRAGSTDQNQKRYY